MVNADAHPTFIVGEIVDAIRVRAPELKVRAELDPTKYPTGRKITTAEMAAINITRDDFHGEWNYTISPRE